MDSDPIYKLKEKLKKQRREEMERNLDENYVSNILHTILKAMSAIIRNIISKIAEISEEVISLITKLVNAYREKHFSNRRETFRSIVIFAISLGIIPAEYGEMAMDIADFMAKTMGC